MGCKLTFSICPSMIQQHLAFPLNRYGAAKVPQPKRGFLFRAHLALNEEQRRQDIYLPV